MEINLSSNGFGNVGMGHNMPDATPVDAKAEAKETSRISPLASFSISNHDVSRAADLASAEPVADVPDGALSRDDALGKLVNAAFGLKPPPMPQFA